MSSPKLRVRASGLGGHGYALPTRLSENGKPLIVPGVTTVLGALDKSGVVQWSIDNTAAYAVANIDALLNRTEEQGFGFLRWYHKRMKESDFDDPTIDIRDYSNGVLNDLAELGTLTHEWVEAHLNGDFEPELVRDEQVQMVERFLEWEADHDLDVRATEATVFGYDRDGNGWAGTLDGIVGIDSVYTLWDLKTSRRIHKSHYAQLAALGSAVGMLVEVDPDHPGAVEHVVQGTGEITYWIEKPVPEFTEYKIMQLRPDDTDNNGEFIPSFAHLHDVPQPVIDAAYEIFEGALRVRHAERKIKQLMKEEG